MNHQQKSESASIKREKECQQALITLFGFMFLFQGLVAQGAVFVATMSMGAAMLTFGLFAMVRL